MTNREFSKDIKLFANDFYSTTVFDLQFAIIKKIMNCKMNQFEKIIWVEGYIKNKYTNSDIVKIIKYYNNQ